MKVSFIFKNEKTKRLLRLYKIMPVHLKGKYDAGVECQFLSKKKVTRV